MAAFFLQLRHLIFLVSMICLTLIFANSLLLNFTIICMEPNDSNIQNNDTSSSMFSPMQRSALFSSTAIGAIIGGIPINRLIGRFTLRKTITGYGLLSALSTLVTPFAFYLFGFPALLVTRILQGTAFPAEYVTNSMVTRKWATLSSAGTFLMLISSHFQLGPLLTMPAAGLFCESIWGWQGIYYVQGGLTLAFFALFYTIFRDTPTEHPWISHQELAQIQCGKRISLVTCKEDGTIMPRNVPYRAILSDWAVWLLLLAFFSDEVGFQIYTQLGPYYLNKVIGIGVAGTGLFAALPYAVSMVTKLLGGPINDLLLSRCLSEKARIKLFAGISQYGIAFSFLGLAFIPLFTHSLWLIMPFYATMNMFTGLDFLGVIRCSQTMSLRHSELISAWEAILSSIIALVLPAIVNAVAPDDSLEQWMRVLMAIALILIFCITAFIVFGKTTPRKWALIDSGSTNVVTDISTINIGIPDKF